MVSHMTHIAHFVPFTGGKKQISHPLLVQLIQNLSLELDSGEKALYFILFYFFLERL